jgi:hypothetical protein
MPLIFFAKSQLKNAVLALPICKKPVGLGANLTLIFSFFMLLKSLNPSNTIA